MLPTSSRGHEMSSSRGRRTSLARGSRVRALWASAQLVVVALVVLAVTTACGGSFPRDTDGSLDRISDGVLRVGVSENPPWTETFDDGRVSGREVDLLTGFAAEHRAGLEWTTGAESELIMAMARGDLDVVVGGLTSDSPWGKEVALTRPYAQEVTPDGDTEEMVMATPMGENGLLVALETYLAHAEDPS